MGSKKIVNICLIIAGLFLYLVASQIAELVFDAVNMPITRDFWLTIPEMIAVGVAVLAYFVVLSRKPWMEFLTEVVTELSKVSYPTQKEASQSALVVVVMVTIATSCLAFFDYVWSSVTRLILS